MAFLKPSLPTLQWVQGLFPPGIKRLGREDDLLLPYSAEIKNAEAINFRSSLRICGTLIN
jgi:hypothetical protein